MKLSLVIPCYNESGNIPLLVSRLHETLAGRDDCEVVLVDNGSTDDSETVFARALDDDPVIRMVRVPINQGYGYGILQGLAAANGDVLAWTHADMQTDPKDVLSAFDFYKNSGGGGVFVKGKRQNRRLLETIFTFGMQVIASAALGVMLDDVNAQPKLFSRKFYHDYVLNKSPHDFSLDLYVLYQAYKNDLRVLEVPVVFSTRLHGEAKGGGSWKTRIKLIKRTLVYIFELRNKLRQGML